MEANPNSSIYNQSYLFKALKEDEVNLLAQKTKLQQYNPGETIYHANQKADTLYVIAQGKVRLLNHEDGYSLGVLSEGDFFGADCLVSPSQRLFTAVSETNTTLLCLNQKVLWRLASQNPSSCAHYQPLLQRENSSQTVTSIGKRKMSIFSSLPAGIHSFYGLRVLLHFLFFFLVFLPC
jgi:signal-transduction protein with cAMP-binding, CBS, and nucleotidyltransferase domain